MKYCSACGDKLSVKVPQGDDRERHVCENCGIIHYQNPKVIVGCIPVWENKVLLCRRAIEPRYGFWTLPAGFMENGESTAEGAARETWEEAKARVDNLTIYRVFDLPYINQVYVFYRCDLRDGQFAAGAESLDCGLYDERSVPWDDLAFRVVKDTLLSFFEDQRRSDYPVVSRVIEYKPRSQHKES